MAEKRSTARRPATARWGAVARGLLDPDRAFASAAVRDLPRLPLLLLLYLMAVVGARLGAGATLVPEARVLAMNEVDARLGSLMAAAPPEAQAQARQQLLDALLGSSSGIALAFSLASSGIAFLGLGAELWLVSLVVTQFFGGQEDRMSLSARPSLGLFLVAWLPLGVRRLAAGVLAAVRPPEAARNALTLAEYRAASAVRLDVASLLGLRGLPPLAAGALRLVTDPFLLWTLAILVLGGRHVFRLPVRAAVGQVLVVLAVLVLQTWLLETAGIRWEI